MPPKAMFRKKLRLSGLEFACCEQCNFGTRATDVVAAFFSRLSTTNDVEDWRVKEAYNFIGGVAQLAPGVIREIFGRRHQRQWFMQPSGLVERVQRIQADGPVVNAMLTVFAAKLGMAFYREHVGSPLPLEGGVYTQFYLNQGLADADASRMLKIMPVHDTLKQGKLHSNEQFGYRYNCDERSIFAALIGFHSSLHFRTIVMTDTEPYRFLLGEYNVDLVRPGELVARVEAVADKQT
ncbi:hypothetical protein [Sphingomonas aerolata]|uniref:hypothetical protein n=1 Tax=Sphingomonas aerolata TaxID=185951 RepID=UPI002FE2E00B